MRKIVSTHLFRRQRLSLELLDTLRAAGLDGVEVFCARSSFDFHDDAQAAALAAWFNERPGFLHSLHSPMYADEKDGRSGEPPIDIADTDHRRRLQALDEIQRALDFSERTPFRYFVQHLGIGGREWSEGRADRALTSLERLRLLCKQAGVSLLVENIPNGLSTPPHLLGFLEQNHLSDIGICFDAGHAHLPPAIFGGGGVLESWEVLGPRVRSTHLHDNHGDDNGSGDEHLWPGEGTIPWPALAPRLAASPELPWVLEVGEATADLAGKLRSTFIQLERWAGAGD